jgi:hypothetical protein
MDATLGRGEPMTRRLATGRRSNMRRVWFVALAVVAAAFAFGGAAKSSAHGPPAGPPDIYITS